MGQDTANRLTIADAARRASEAGVSMNYEKMRRRLENGEVKGGESLGVRYIDVASLDAFIARELLAQAPTADPAA